MQRLFRIVLVAAIVVTLYFALYPAPPQLLKTDKSQHELAFAVLALLSVLAFPAARWIVVFGLLALFGAAIEILQLIPALHRTTDVKDWIADIAAIAVTLLLVALVRRAAGGAAWRRT